jgi:hypothetical protein
MFFAAIVMLLFLDAGVGLACSLFLVDDKFVVVWVILSLWVSSANLCSNNIIHY